MAKRIDIEQLKFLSPDEVREVADRFGTPVFVYDEATMAKNAEYMATLPSAFGLTVRYSLKACPTQGVVRVFDRLGLAFDASSVWEAKRAVRAGVAAEKILLTAQQAEDADGLRDLVDAGLQFDAGSLRQLDRYGEAYPGSEVSIRINPGFGSGLVRRLTSGGPDSSFGLWHESMPEALDLVRKHGLTVRRLHTHIGSGHHWDVLVRAVELLLRLARVMPDVEVLDLGGGYRLKALIEDPEYDHTEWAAAVAGLLERFAGETGRKLRLEVEPGTYLMATAGSIVTRVIDIASTGEDGHTFVKIDCGLTEILRPSYYGAVHPLVSVAADGPMRAAVRPYCVAGHCCIAGDVLTTRIGDVEELDPVYLSATEVGDYLVIERGGGYCSSMAMKNFNSYPEAPEVLRREDGTFELIRERQTLDQMIGNEVVGAVPTEVA
jgi:diaminopimelate decarboxylase